MQAEEHRQAASAVLHDFAGGMRLGRCKHYSRRVRYTGFDMAVQLARAPVKYVSIEASLKIVSSINLRRLILTGTDNRR